MPGRSITAYALFIFSLFVYAVFWVWAVIHATQTPRASKAQRTLWGVAMVANPTTAIWYWYIWKRKVFWALFTPMLLAFGSFPFVVRSVLSKADATAITNILFALGSTRLVILTATLMLFPLLLRLVALLHLGKNTELSAMDRNDWIVSLALPVFGFGAGIAYCTRFKRNWALVGLLWSVVIALSLKTVTLNISQALIPEGDELRMEFRLKK
ncbi:MAG: hypothetical protein ABH861_02760 [Patescibacteria group bacterium]|nr:hypothetical protein [Patescibacteria group bacterium]